MAVNVRRFEWLNQTIQGIADLPGFELPVHGSIFNVSLKWGSFVKKSERCQVGFLPQARIGNQ